MESHRQPHGPSLSQPISASQPDAAGTDGHSSLLASVPWLLHRAPARSLAAPRSHRPPPSPWPCSQGLQSPGPCSEGLQSQLRPRALEQTGPPASGCDADWSARAAMSFRAWRGGRTRAVAAAAQRAACALSAVEAPVQRGKLLAYHSDHHVVPLPPQHRFPMDKYRMTRLALQADVASFRSLDIREARALLHAGTSTWPLCGSHHCSVAGCFQCLSRLTSWHALSRRHRPLRMSWLVHMIWTTLSVSLRDA